MRMLCVQVAREMQPAVVDVRETASVDALAARVNAELGACHLLVCTRKLVRIERYQRISAAVRQLTVEFKQTHIAASALGQRGIKAKAAVLHDIRKITKQ